MTLRRIVRPRVAVRQPGLAIFLALALAACASVPSQEMSDARRAVDAAREAGAKLHSPAALGRASSSLDQAASALRGGDYDAARALAVAARDEAIAARLLADLVANTEAAIAAARDAGRHWEGARGLLDKALETSRRGDSGRALEIARRAQALVP